MYSKFLVLTAAIINSTDFWDVTLHSSVERYEHFRELACPHLQGKR
jgi:hypothetical protein